MWEEILLLFLFFIFKSLFLFQFIYLVLFVFNKIHVLSDSFVWCISIFPHFLALPKVFDKRKQYPLKKFGL